MSNHKFSRKPVEVNKVLTRNRTINTSIPCEGTEEVLARLDELESRSMHGQIPIIWESAKDFNVFDLKKNKFIDFTSAIFFANVGHSNNKVSDAMTSSIKKPLIGCYAYGNEIRAKYLEKLIKFAGTSFDKAFLLSAGTETTEAALKLMRMYGQSVGKKNLGIIGIENNWHGRTLGAQMMSSNASQKAWVGKLDNDIYHIPFPYEWSLKGESGESFFNKGIENLISEKNLNPKEDITGMIFETFQGWGAIFYPKDFVKAAENFCRKNNILIAFDEMQSGFGRTGKAFGYEHYDVNPDLICCGKGMGNGFPLSGVIGKKEIMDLPEIGNMSSTHSANPLSCAAGLAVIEEIEDRKLIKESRDKGFILDKKLNELKDNSSGRISHINCMGLIAAVLFKNPENGQPDSIIASKIAEKCYQKGLLVVHTGRESIKIGPPLTISQEALDEGIEVLSEAFFETIREI